MDILKTQLDLGLVQPIRILQVSDCHLSGCCEEDSEKAKAKSKKKTAEFLKETGGVTQEQRLKEALDLSAEYDALVFTGDMADSPSRANLELLASMLEGRRYLYTFGNHDYYTYDSDNGNADDREHFLDDFLRFLPCDPTMDSLQVGGVNLVALDDSLACLFCCICICRFIRRRSCLRLTNGGILRCVSGHPRTCWRRTARSIRRCGRRLRRC